MSLSSASVMALELKNALDWWDTLNNSILWQDRIFYTLAGLYGFVALVALIQLIRIEIRVPEYGWTTQKVFHFLNFIVNGVRCLVFVFRRNVQRTQPVIMQHIMLDMPSLAFFTTYALLVLFWAEIYYQARAVSTDGLRPSFYTINAIVYAIQIAMWLILWWKPIPLLITLSKLFFAGVSFFAALGFLLYGGRLFLMLRRFPVESKGRRKKLQEVGYVTTICFTCFLIRCIMMCFNAFDEAADLDVLTHPILNFLYYLLVEIVPSCLVLFILRKLPPKRGYHTVSSYTLNEAVWKSSGLLWNFLCSEMLIALLTTSSDRRNVIMRWQCATLSSWKASCIGSSNRVVVVGKCCKIETPVLLKGVKFLSLFFRV